MTQPEEVQANGTAESHHLGSYWCLNHHRTILTWSAAADVPELWTCPHCGLPKGQDETRAPQPTAARPYKTPLAHLLERRSEADCEALLAEALKALRARRGCRDRSDREHLGSDHERSR
jgi:hypothetical protein